MLSLDTLTKLLGYADSPSFRTKENQFEPEAVQLFRLAKDKERSEANFRVKGFYVISSSARAEPVLAPRPAVCVAEADTPQDARHLHRRIWNLGNIPFLIVRLPKEVCVYTGFRYKQSSNEGLILKEDSPKEQKLLASLSDFTAESVDSARIWLRQRRHLETKYRVDSTLLENLKYLAQALAKHCAPVLALEVAHALIGKFVYLRYLRDRRILDDDWLAKRRIDLTRVFGPAATVSELDRLVDALESRFNGDVFHIDFGPGCSLTDSHVQLVASVFAGDDVRVSATGITQQLHLRFSAYDFRHIPIEMLSSIYQQFLRAEQRERQEGAYYTPEVLADYLLSEINSIRALRPGMTILDPACGSGIFLVLAYRRLVELELTAVEKHHGDLDPVRLREILLQSIFGVERQRDACNVTMFSLILTLLNYVDPPTLHANESFRFPNLLNKRIFCDDFFNPGLDLPVPKGGFDVVVGNPPWIELNPKTKGETHAREWIAHEEIIAGNRVHDAFAVKAGRELSKEGVAGMVLPATTLFNLEGKQFRRDFFTEFAVARITNFANLRANLFGRRSILPATTLVFAKANEARFTKPVIHHGPFAVNQIAGDSDELWVLTIHSSEIQLISQSDAITGETSVWKLALWGTPRDARALDRIRQLYPLTLERFCEKRGWGKRMPREGAQLRDKNTPGVVYCEELKGKKRFDTGKFNKIVRKDLQFSIPREALIEIPDNKCYVRLRGGLSGLEVNKPPHLLIPEKWKNFLLFSDEYFAVPPRQIGITAPGDSKALRALTVYLASSLVDYFLFFQVPVWGVYSTYMTVVLRAVREIPTPDFNEEQIRALTDVHRQILRQERSEQGFALKADDSFSAKEKQHTIDKSLFDVLGVPDDVRLLVEDFRDNRLLLDTGFGALRKLGKRPAVKELQAYGRTLRDELEHFLLGEAHPSVRFITTPDLIQCEMRLHPAGSEVAQVIQIFDADRHSNVSKQMRGLREALSEDFSQWVYVDRSLRVHFDDAVQIFKAPCLMDWTRTRALNDADAIIAEILAEGEPI